jgi:hypothetical protein
MCTLATAASGVSEGHALVSSDHLKSATEGVATGGAAPPPAEEETETDPTIITL